ncbi:MAG TPA: hypothetical protein VJL82_08435 [Rhizomicrobium sp.]|nr:hypothetical protein [Rhizomicrobium sp.]
MQKHIFAATVLALSVMTSAAFGQASRLAIQSEAARAGTPAWQLRASFPDPSGFTMVEADGTVNVIPREQRIRASLPAGYAATPACKGSPVCSREGGFIQGDLARVLYDQNLGYKFSYPYFLPKGIGGVPSVALDSKGNLWVFKRSPPGVTQLMKFDADHKLILEVPQSVIGYQEKAHGMAVDAQDNVWIADAGQATVKKLSPEGKLLLTIGERGKRGDWIEEKEQRLLWQPVMIAFGPKGEVYIGMGHAYESPNDAGSPDPWNKIGAARVLQIAADGTFVRQWFGNEVGQGKFNDAHGLAVDPANGDVWIGDREQYRIVVYTADGRFKKTLQTKNLVCALNFDRQGNPWMASGQDGQFLKLNRDGKVLGAVGNGMGIGHGQFMEASYWAFDKNNNLIAGDTSVGRVTVMTK